MKILLEHTYPETSGPHSALRLSGNSSTRHRRKECRIGKLCRKEAIRQIQEATTGEARLLRSVLLREAGRDSGRPH
ncbi:hypothetical protein KY284_033092 [Solanum tuberosum]|nr:hypothetical protein KY284_033092 [Solanum tuberosum]